MKLKKQLVFWFTFLLSVFCGWSLRMWNINYPGKRRKNMARPDKAQVDKAAKTLDRLADQMEKFRAKLQNPNLTQEEIDEYEEKIDKIQADMDDLTGGGPQVTPV